MHDIRDILRLFLAHISRLRVLQRGRILDEGQIQLGEAGVEEPRIRHALFEQSELGYSCHRLRVGRLLNKSKKVVNR